MIIDIIKSLYYEAISYLVPERSEYEITGACKQCGKCCNYMYSFDTYTEKEFELMQKIFPAYKRFYIKGKDEHDNFIFACKYVQENGQCSVYKNRLAMCRRYPVPKIKYPASMHEGCGFIIQKKTFKDYLK